MEKLKELMDQGSIVTYYCDNTTAFVALNDVPNEAKGAIIMKFLELSGKGIVVSPVCELNGTEVYSLRPGREI